MRGSASTRCPYNALRVRSSSQTKHRHVFADLDPLWLIMHFIPFCEGISCSKAPEAAYYPEIFDQFCDRVGCQLMKLCLELLQNACERMVRRHTQTRNEEIFEHDNFVTPRLWSSLFPRLAGIPFSEVALVHHLADPTNGNH